MRPPPPISNIQRIFFCAVLGSISMYTLISLCMQTGIVQLTSMGFETQGAINVCGVTSVFVRTETTLCC